MKKSVISSLVASAVLAVTCMVPATTQAATHKVKYPSCSSLEKKLSLKIKRLKTLAAERTSLGDNYGARRLKANANVVAAHRGNLPCVKRQTCGI